MLRGWDEDGAREELGRVYDGELERADEDGRETDDEDREDEYEGELSRADGREMERLEE